MPEDLNLERITNAINENLPGNAVYALIILTQHDDGTQVRMCGTCSKQDLLFFMKEKVANLEKELRAS